MIKDAVKGWWLRWRSEFDYGYKGSTVEPAVNDVSLYTSPPPGFPPSSRPRKTLDGILGTPSSEIRRGEDGWDIAYCLGDDRFNQICARNSK